MTNIIQQLSHAVAVTNGKNDYITPGKQNHRKFPVAVSTEPSAHMNDVIVLSFVFSPGATQPIVGVYFTALYRALVSSRTRLLDYIQRRATVGRTPLNE
jgi:hypothetical protein